MTENRESRVENREPKTESRKLRTENREPKTDNRQLSSVLGSRFSVLCCLFSVLCFCSLFSVLLFSCSPSSSPTLAKINGEKVSAEEFQKYLRVEEWKFGGELPLASKNTPGFKNKILDHFLKERILLQEAERVGIRIDSKAVDESIEAFKGSYARPEDFEKLLVERGWTLAEFKEQRGRELRIQKLVETVAQKHLQIQEDELKKYYKTHREAFEYAEQVHARQIVTDSREKAEALRDLLVKGTSFEEVALKYSISPDRKRGGDLGWFERGVMPKEFDTICFSLKGQGLSPVVATPYGFHLFQVLGRRPAGRTAWEEAKEEIQEKIMAEKGREVFQKWYEGLREKTEVKIYAEVLAKIQ